MTASPTRAAVIRHYDDRVDADWLLALNNAHSSEVGEADPEGLAQLTASALAVRVAEREGRPVGVLVALARGLSYDSLNYRWFVERDNAPFLYVDRIVVAPEAKGAGIGRALYEDAFRIAREGAIPRIVCEVNERPPNPASMAFHKRLGFTSLSVRENEASGKRVVMMEKRLG